MFVFLLLAARMLEQRARSIANAQVDALARARPAFATRERADGSRETVPVAQLRDRRHRLRRGRRGGARRRRLLAPAPLRRGAADRRIAPGRQARGRPGATPAPSAASTPARLRVTETGAPPACRNSRGWSSRRRRSARRWRAPPIASPPCSCRPAAGRRGDLRRLARSTTRRARFEVTLALLVISCPCALSLSMPAALTAAHGALARLGVLPVRADALDRLADVDRHRLRQDRHAQRWRTAAGPHRSASTASTMTGAAHRRRARARQRPPDRDARSPTSPMRRWRIDVAPCRRAGHRWASSMAGAGGSARRLRRRRATTTAPLARRRRARRRALQRAGSASAPMPRRAREPARAGSGGAPVQRRRPQVAVQRFAAQLGIDHAHARQTPEDKLARVRALQASGRVVAMVGDGLNDAPVLAGADVSLAIGDGAALAQRARRSGADRSPRLPRIPQAIALARRTRTRDPAEPRLGARLQPAGAAAGRRWDWSRRGWPRSAWRCPR